MVITLILITLRNYPLSGKAKRRKDGGFVVAWPTPKWWNGNFGGTTQVRAVVLGFSPTTTDNNNNKPQTLKSRREDSQSWGKQFSGRPESKTLEWCSHPYKTEQAAEEARKLAQSGQFQYIDLWYLNCVEQGKK